MPPDFETRWMNIVDDRLSRIEGKLDTLAERSSEHKGASGVVVAIIAAVFGAVGSFITSFLFSGGVHK